MVANLISILGGKNHFNALVCDHIKSIPSLYSQFKYQKSALFQFSNTCRFNATVYARVLTEANPEVIIVLASVKNRFFAALRENSDDLLSFISGKDKSDWMKNIKNMPPNTRAPDMRVVGVKGASECNSIAASVFLLE